MIFKTGGSARLIRIAAIGLASTALIAGGCGDDEDEGASASQTTTPAEESTAPPPKPPTKQEYIAEADQICKKANRNASKIVKDINDNLAKLGSATTLEAQKSAASAVAKGVDQLADARDEVTGELEALEAPKGGAADKYLRARDKNTQALRDQAKAYKAFGKAPTQQTSNAATAAGKKSNALAAVDRKLAEAYGFKTCGQPAK
jgi:hypothetical protein